MVTRSKTIFLSLNICPTDLSSDGFFALTPEVSVEDLFDPLLLKYFLQKTPMTEVSQVSLVQQQNMRPDH